MRFGLLQTSGSGLYRTRITQDRRTFYLRHNMKAGCVLKPYGSFAQVVNDDTHTGCHAGDYGTYNQHAL